MNQCLEHRDAVFGVISSVAKSCERQAVGRAIGKIELTVGIEAFVLRILQAFACRFNHAGKFDARWRFNFQPADIDEIVQCLPAHGRRSFSEPKMKIFGACAIRLTTELLSAVLTSQSSDERNIGLIFRAKTFSAFCKAV